MKKITSKLLPLMMALVMALGLVACGSDKPYSSVSDYINSDEVQEQLSTLEKSLEGSGMNMKITAEGDKLVYTYTFDNTEKTDELAAQLEESIKAQDSTLQNTANQVKEFVDVDSATVAVKYIDSKGEEIFSKEYVSQ